MATLGPGDVAPGGDAGACASPRGAGTGAASKDEAALLETPAHLTDRDRELVRLVASTGC
jgi:hypothetical protein